MDVIQSRIERGELTFNATLADALAGYGFAFVPNRKTAVADLMRFTDAESGNAFTADNPKLYGELDALFNQALPLYAFRKNRTKDAKANARQFKMEKRADAVLRSPLRMFYVIEETAQPPAVIFSREAQNARFAAVVDGERNRAFHAPVIERLERIEAKTDNLTAFTKDLADELATWREWVQKLATNPKTKTPAPPLCAPIQAAIVRLWETFNAQPADCEDTTEPSGWRTHKRTYNECLHLHGNDDIWHGRKLIDLTPDAKSLERVIHNAKEKKRQKKAAASATQARRKK